MFRRKSDLIRVETDSELRDKHLKEKKKTLGNVNKKMGWCKLRVRYLMPRQRKEVKIHVFWLESV